MIEREKVVRAVETCFDSWIDRHRDKGLDLQVVEQMKHDALELLKEHEAVAPKLVGVNTWTCGNCGTLLGFEDFSQSGIELINYKYCPECGKAVQWSE